MNEVNQENNNNATPNMPVKRKRGRPRKDPSLNRRDNSRVPPGFVVNGNQPRQVLAIEDANPSIVGQAVMGVVEGAFDAGYLLAVKIGNSNTTLRGVVFKTGHYIPISPQNDVAPHVQMIRRNEIPLPMQNPTRVRGRRPRKKNDQHGNLRRIETGQLVNGTPPGQAFAVPYVGSRGTVVPVVLQPVTISNGFPPAIQIPPILSQAGHTMPSSHNLVQMVTSQVGLSQPQTSHLVTLGGVRNASAQDDGNKMVQGSFQSSETRIENCVAAGKVSVEDSGTSAEGDSDDMSEPLSVEPLQTIHTNFHTQSGPVSMTAENNGIGRMSELLRAVQEKMKQPGASS